MSNKKKFSISSVMFLYIIPLALQTYYIFILERSLASSIKDLIVRTAIVKGELKSDFHLQ